MNILNEVFIEPELSIKKREFKPASYLRREFTINSEIDRAEIYITACGLYLGYVNGRQITNQVFMPGFTYYKKRLQYQTYDVTSLITKGTNVIGVILGDGWYRGKIGGSSKRNLYGTKTKLALILKIHLSDNTEFTLTTDDKWKATQDGPIRKSDWKDGEIYDARKELTGWLEPNFDESQWHEVLSANYSGNLVPSEGEEILEHEKFSPDVIITPDGSTVLDFKQNLFGYVEFTVEGKAGHQIKLSHGETLDEHGNFTLKNLTLQNPIFNFLFQSSKLLQEIHYTLKGGQQIYKPHFTAHGFRYVKIENWPEPIKPENFASIAVYSDMQETGSFECSNPLVNQLVHNSLWSQKSNFLDIPTDCPQRERAGWTGDIACYAPTAVYLMNVRKFLKKWMKDLSLQQRKNGRVASIVPDVGILSFTDGAAGWADAAVIVPYILYNAYGDILILEEQYESMKNWIDFLKRRAKKTHYSRWLKKNPYKKYTIDYGFQYGEWLEPGNVMAYDGIKGFLWPDFEIATAYYAYSSKLMSEISAILGKEVESQKYQELCEKIKEGYRYNYTDEGTINSKRQCKYVRPVALDLISEEEKKEAMKKLNELVIKNNYKIGTGFLTTPFILQQLCKYGYSETAYGMLENTERPGWLYEVKNGATTIWENWNGKDEKGKPTDSFNHYLMGSVTSWLFSHAAGIRPLEPGYKRVMIKPIPGGSFTYVNCSFKSASGLIKSSWTKNGENFNLNIEVPTEAEVILPDNTKKAVPKGVYEFSCKIPSKS
ncbi:MAG: alpha-L-rhamnosidase [Promethearchaeota archaeon]|nr:MAG: alpha-L-rhamnosidase [Candidatus Lokiarchaeota archaeon]